MFKPKTPDATSIRERRDEAQVQLDAVKKKVAEAEARRGAVLVDADAKTAMAFQADLRQAQDEMSGLADVVATLGARLAAAEKAEAEAKLRDDWRTAEAECAAVAALLHDEYPRLAAKISEILRREQAAYSAANTVIGRREKLEAAGHDLADLARIEPVPRRRIFPELLPSDVLLGGWVTLPDPVRGGKTLWPPLPPTGIGGQGLY
jgi:hypothetical protein